MSILINYLNESRHQPKEVRKKRGTKWTKVILILAAIFAIFQGAQVLLNPIHPDSNQKNINTNSSNRGTFVNSFNTVLPTNALNSEVPKIADSTKRQLIAVVLGADRAEFNCYRYLRSAAWRDSLQKYLDTTGSAYLRIVGVIQRRKARHWTINNKGNPSTYKVYELEVPKFNDTEATITTTEYWYLRSFISGTHKCSDIYNENNLQTWSLSLENGMWKVTETYYPSRKNIAMPD